MKSKFKNAASIVCSLGTGTVMEINPSSVFDGKPQYRVRIDSVDHWVEEKDMKLDSTDEEDAKLKAEEDAKLKATPPTPPTK